MKISHKGFSLSLHFAYWDHIFRQKFTPAFMNYPSYDIAISEHRLRYEFISIGTKGHLNAEGDEESVETTGTYIAFLVKKK